MPDRLSMTILSFFERCPRSAYLHLTHGGGAGSHAMARGSLFHAFAEKATWALLENREQNLYAKAEGEDPAHAKQNVASLTAAIVDECQRDSGRHIGQAEKDDARVCAYHWAVGSDFDPSTVVGVEEKWILEVGGRIVVGKLDLIHVHNGVLTVTDYKTTKWVAKREDIERSFQLKLYAALVAFGRPVEKVPCEQCEGTGVARGGNGLRLTCAPCDERGYTEKLGPRLASTSFNQLQTREVYPFELGDDGLMRKQSRAEPLTRTELADFLVDLEGYVEEFDAALKSGVWEAIPGEPQCGYCPAWSECPIAESVRAAAFDPEGTRQSEDGGVETPEQAQESAERWTFLAALHKAEAKKLRAYLKQHGSVEFGDFEVLLETQTSRVTDHESLAVASASGQPFDLGSFRKERVSTVMKRRKRPKEAA